LTGSRKWPATAWRQLLSLALPALDEVGADVRWTLGGGTALALKLNHRISYDIDIFLEDAGHLHALSPNRNSASRAITDRWQEPGHYVKLVRDEGEIDFLVAAQLTELDPWILPFERREIRVEQPAEILAKKLKYRGSRFAVRDIFDLLAIHAHDPTIVAVAVAAATEATRRAIDRIQRIAPRYRDSIEEEINPTATGAVLVELDPLEAVEILRRAASPGPRA
jgi:hypothetical protein